MKTLTVWCDGKVITNILPLGCIMPQTDRARTASDWQKGESKVKAKYLSNNVKRRNSQWKMPTYLMIF